MFIVIKLVTYSLYIYMLNKMYLQKHVRQRGGILGKSYWLLKHVKIYEFNIASHINEEYPP
jgi:hypothetical protein